jgi:hypothetical protein
MTEAQTKELNDVVAKAVAAAMAAQVKAAPVTDNGDAVNPQLAKRHAAILNAFRRRGKEFAGAKLFIDIKPYKLWLAENRQVRKGEKSVRGLFHIKQTDPIAKKAN